jgi:tetratricopeptide (TPR) repeat protein
VTPSRVRHCAAPLALSAILLGASAAAAAPGRAPTAEVRAFQRELDAGLEHYRSHRYAEAQAALLRALALMPEGGDRSNLEFDIAACDYELGHYRDAEARFVRVAESEAHVRGDSLVHAAWAALGAGDVDAAQTHVDAAVAAVPSLTAPRELIAAIDQRRRERESAAFDARVSAVTAAYDSGDLSAAEAAIRAARPLEANGARRSRAALEYLTGLVAHERGDDVRARAALEASLKYEPESGSVHALLGELSQAEGDGSGAERHYRASLASDLSPAEQSAVNEALDALYPLPVAGLDAWGALAAGYDSNATLSGSGETVGYSGASSQDSPFAAPAWGVEYRWNSGAHARLGGYYAGDWLLLGNSAVEDASLQSHEAGLRWYYAPSTATELRLGIGGGATLSGLEPSPFSLDGLVRARFAIHHGPNFQSALLLEVRPSLGLAGRDELDGARTDGVVGERFRRGRWNAGMNLGLRHNALGNQRVGISEQQFPRCNAACNGARYVIPLGYWGPTLGLDAGMDVTAALELGVSAKYEYRTYLEASRIEGPGLPVLVRRLSEKVRADDRYLLGAHARYQLSTAADLGLSLDYSLRISRSNVAYERSDPEHAFDYDDRNFTQHVIAFGFDVHR